MGLELILLHSLKQRQKIFRIHVCMCRALNCFGPNINLIRDPRWGRASETYGEDPYLSAELSIAYVKGLQGNDSKYVKVLGTSLSPSSCHEHTHSISQVQLTYLLNRGLC